MPPIISDRSYYDILALPAPSHDRASPEILTSQAVKKAYHKALLRWHPDKASVDCAVSPGRHDKFRVASSPAGTPQGYTLDEIITAYTTLSTERGRWEYEKQYRLRLAGSTMEEVRGLWNTYVPMEVVDLDDFEYEDMMGKFYKSCRCGEDEGYVLWERDLEEVETGEVEVGCVGCSLWLRVQFEVVPEWEGKDDTGNEAGIGEKGSAEVKGEIKTAAGGIIGQAR